MTENNQNSGAVALKKLPPRVYDLIKIVKLKQFNELPGEHKEQVMR